MEKLEYIIECYINNKNEKSAGDIEFLEENIIGRSSNDISQLLANFLPDETGGLVALSGFYYQFLVAIEYMIDMLEGKWDYIFIEHLDDIVVGKENTVRFVQVKTSEKVKIDVTASPASGLYSRSEIQGGAARKNNSWIDKLISKAELLKSEDGFNTQFQLYSSYHFLKTRNYDFDIYSGNKGYNMDVPMTDHLLSKCMEPVCDKNGANYDYQKRCGETLDKLLGRFYLHTGAGLHELEVFKDHLCMSLSKWLFRDIGDQVRIRTEDLNELIGHLCTQCTYRDSADRLLITQEKLEEILTSMRERTLASVDIIAERHGNMTVASRVIDSIVSEIEDSGQSSFLKDKLYSYREYFRNWIENGGNIRSLIDRYVEGTIKSSAYIRIGEINRERRIQDFFSIVLILMIVRNSLLEFTDSKSLLTKKCSASNLLYSFLSLETRNKFENGIQKLESIILQSDVNEHLNLLDKTLQIVFQNYTDRNFTETKREEIRGVSEISLEGFEDVPPLNKVTLFVDVIPGNEMKEAFFEAIDETTDFPQKMQEILNKFCSEVR